MEWRAVRKRALRAAIAKRLDHETLILISHECLGKGVPAEERLMVEWRVLRKTALRSAIDQLSASLATPSQVHKPSDRQHLVYTVNCIE